MQLLQVLRDGNFRRLWTGGSISAFGDMVLLIALPFHVYNLTGSTLATGGTFLAQTLPRLVLGSVAGVLADRWDRRRTMIAVDLSRALVLLPLLLVRSAEWVWLVYGVALAKSSLSQFFSPSYNALLPRLVARESLVAANSMTTVSTSVVRLTAPVLGGALLAGTGIASVVLIDAGSYLVSAAFVWAIRVPAGETRAHARAARSLFEQWIDGFRILSANPLLCRLIAVAGVAMTAQGLINVLLVPFVKDLLQGSALDFGWLATAQGLGTLVGGLVVGHLGARATTLPTIGLSLVLAGVLFLFMVNFPSLHVALVLISVIGVPSSFFAIGTQTLFQVHTADEHRGRMFGVYGSISVLMLMLGMGGASVLGDRWPLQTVLTMAGGTFLLAGALGLVLGARIVVPEPVAAEEQGR